MKLLVVLLAWNLVSVVLGHRSEYIPVISENIKSCGSTGILDISAVDLIAYNDTLTYLNGTVKFNKVVNPPWKVMITSKRFQRGDWNDGEARRTIFDLCAEMQNPAEVWYPVTKNLRKKNCPYKAKTIEEFNMAPMTGFILEIPPNFEGQWKIKVDMIFNDLPGMKKERECVELSFEIMEF